MKSSSKKLLNCFVVPISDKEPFIIGDRVKTRFNFLTDRDQGLEGLWSAGTIVGIDGQVAEVLFDDLRSTEVRAGVGIISPVLGWRIERLEFEYTVDLGEEYFF